MNAVSTYSACSGTTNKRPRIARLALACTIIFLANSALAQSSPGRFELTPYGGYRFGGSFEDFDAGLSADLDDDASFGLVLNLRESGNTQWELIYSQQNTAVDTREFAFADPFIDVDLQYLQIGGTYMGEGQRARPYVAATVGGTHISPDLPTLDSDTFWSFSIGGGLQVFPTKRVGLRLEARAWGTLLSSSTSLFCSSGPQGGLCAITVDGDVLWQFETFVGVVFRF